MPARLTSHADIESALADRRLLVAEAPKGSRGVEWLRCKVSRFTNGDEHTRRRQLVEAELARLPTSSLRRDARERVEALVSRSRGEVDVVKLARGVPLAALAVGLQVSEERLHETVAAAIVIGPAFLSGVYDEHDDHAVELLRGVLDRGGDEETAAAIAVLAQACEATAALITAAVVVSLEEPALRRQLQGLVEETLRRRPPLRAMRRVSPQGEPVLLDIDAASRNAPPESAALAFGAGFRPCPGEEHARALTIGVLEALLPRVTGDASVEYGNDNAVLRLPARLTITMR